MMAGQFKLKKKQKLDYIKMGRKMLGQLNRGLF